MTGMSFMQAMDMIGVVLRGAVTIIVVLVLATGLRRDFIKAEQIGLGVMGGGSVMTLPIVYLRHPTPFDSWAGTVLALGALVFVGARGFRALRHWWANRMMAERRR